ncbi:MAG: sulfurtransferase [Opitutaceae bacterium]|nr:sulfurtransferase [Opitutaceae bacterium]
MQPLHSIEPAAVRARIRDGREVAFLDLREAGPHGRAKPLFAVNIPLGHLEERIHALVPRQSTPIILFDAETGLSQRGAEVLAALGYTEVVRVRGTLADWRRAGAELFRDTNVPSKAFGEWVEQEAHTPEISAEELKALRDRGEDVVVIDDRPFTEYRVATVPGSINVPGAELILRAQELQRSPDTLVVVHCAGRTRSLIGTQTLVNSGLFRRVVGLRDGNIGWHLAGFSLEHGADRRAPVHLAPANHARARAAATHLAERTGVRFLTAAELARWEREADRHSLFKFDVRSPEEFAARRAPGFASAPGGQLIQATDEYIGVLNARVVLGDDDGVRAATTASWLRQLGFEQVAVLRDGLRDQLASLPTPERAWVRPPDVPQIEPNSLQSLIGTPGVVVVDLRLSSEYAAGHIPGSWYAPRARLAEALPAFPRAERIILVSSDGYRAAFAQPELQALTTAAVTILAGGFSAWPLRGRPVQTGLIRAAVPPDDIYRRPLENDPDAMKRHYIAWELGLPAQVRNDGTARFVVHTP